VRILIAEDDATSRLLLMRVLESWGYEVETTRDGAEAWRILRDPEGPRLAILDWMMPEMDGIEVCSRVRALETMQPPYVILLTALGDKDSVVAGLQAGADDYLSKPYDAAELHARVEVGRRLVELNEQLLEAQRKAEEQARTDALTGILNRGAILAALEQEIARADREGTSLGLGMLDIDHFKQVNDTCGHAAGDEVLREVVRRIETVLRPYDTLGRFGGEEFLLIVPGVDEAELSAVAERVRRVVAAGPVHAAGQRFEITVSVGATLRRQESPDGLIARADSWMYAAKDDGRDRVVMADGADDGADAGEQ
jgi:two-component system cell cycle response regulator